MNLMNTAVIVRCRGEVGTSLNGNALARMAVVAAVLLGTAGAGTAQDILVPNGSFETPNPPPGFPATPQIDIWQKSPAPPGFDPAFFGGLTWDQMSGIFPNPAVGQPARLNNMAGNQAAYVFTVPGVGLSQDLATTVQAGYGYKLTAGVVGGGGILPGTSFNLSLYYRDALNAPVTLATTSIQYSISAFPTTTDFVDFDVKVPTLLAGDAAVGRTLGINLESATATGGGYWDLDNIRLTAVPATPEPGALALLALGLGGCVWARQVLRRRV